MLNASVLRPLLLLPLILLAALAGGIGLFTARSNYDWQGLIIVVAAVGILSIFLIPRLAKIEAGGFLLRILACGLVLKLVFAMIRSWVAFGLYEGIADVTDYDSFGTIISQHIWRGEFDQVAPFLEGGTNFLNFFTGVTYSIIGPTLYGAYIVYAFLAFLGSYFFYKAFRLAAPQGNYKLYAILIFLFPSILFWPNGIGKDALIFLFIGLFAYGSAQLTRDRLQGLIPLALGTLGVLLIRPHIATMLAIALVLAFLVRGVGKRGVRPATYIIVLLVVSGVVWFLIPIAMAFVGLEKLSPDEVFSALQLQQSLTYQGGSAFQVMDITKPWTFPMGVVTLLFRPFPWEAHNFQALVQSLEGVLFIGIVLWRIKSIGKALAASISNTYARYLLIYIIVFVFSFSIISNFGILARERSMLLPFVFMLIAYTGPVARTESKPVESQPEEAIALCKA